MPKYTVSADFNRSCLYFVHLSGKEQRMDNCLFLDLVKCSLPRGKSARGKSHRGLFYLHPKRRGFIKSLCASSHGSGWMSVHSFYSLEFPELWGLHLFGRLTGKRNESICLSSSFPLILSKSHQPKPPNKRFPKIGTLAFTWLKNFLAAAGHNSSPLTHSGFSHKMWSR